MEKRRKNLILSKLINELYNVNMTIKNKDGKIYKYNYTGINIDGKVISNKEFYYCKNELEKIKEKALFYLKGNKNPNTFLMSKYLGVPPFICRDLINNL